MKISIKGRGIIKAQQETIARLYNTFASNTNKRSSTMLIAKRMHKLNVELLNKIAV